MPTLNNHQAPYVAETVKRVAVYPTAPTAASWDGGSPLSRWAWVIETDPGQPFDSRKTCTTTASHASVYRGACDSHADALRGLAAHLLVIAEAVEQEGVVA